MFLYMFVTIIFILLSHVYLEGHAPYSQTPKSLLALNPKKAYVTQCLCRSEAREILNGLGFRVWGLGFRV